MGERGKIHYREQMTDGLENAPQTFIGLLEGKTSAKSLFVWRMTINKTGGGVIPPPRNIIQTAMRDLRQYHNSVGAGS